MVRTLVTHSACASCATFLFLPHFDVICDLLLNRCMVTWNLFVIYIYIYIYINCNARVKLFGHLFATLSFMLHAKQSSGDIMLRMKHETQSSE